MRVRRPLSRRKHAITAPRRPRPGDAHRRLGSERAGGTVEAEASEPVQPDARERLVRESGGPQDEAYYGCACGYQFTARVDTDVICPHCGTLQAW